MKSAIVVSPSPISHDALRAAEAGPADYMPLAVRMRVAGELNRLWEEFVTTMYGGPFNAPDLPEKFWKYVTR